MSWATCYSGSNNIHLNFPPLMSDGRQFTHLDPSCEANDRLKKFLNLNTNYEYRQYLINNGNTLINKNRMDAFMLNNNTKVGNGSQETNNKYIFNSVHDGNKPFGYEGSDLKNLYLSRQQLQSSMEAPIINLNK